MVCTKVKVVVIDSGFYILQLLIDLKKVGVFTAEIVKKHKKRPIHVPAEEINNYMKKKDIGDVTSLCGKLYE